MHSTDAAPSWWDVALKADGFANASGRGALALMPFILDFAPTLTDVFAGDKFVLHTANTMEGRKVLLLTSC